MPQVRAMAHHEGSALMANRYPPNGGARIRWKHIRSWRGPSCQLTTGCKLKQRHGGKCWMGVEA